VGLLKEDVDGQDKARFADCAFFWFAEPNSCQSADYSYWGIAT
jgi:hypothetical protein